MQSSKTKVILYIFATILVVGCSSKNEAVAQLNANKNSYKKLKMTKALLVKSAVIYVTYNKESQSFKVELNSREPEEETDIQKCLVNKTKAIVEALKSSTYQWQNSFIVYSSVTPKKSTTLSCTLSSGDRFSVTF